MRNQKLIFTSGYSNSYQSPLPEDDIETYMKDNMSLNLHEVITGGVKPYYECDCKYDTEEDRIENYYQDFVYRYKQLSNLYQTNTNKNIKIHCLDASGECKSEKGNYYKNSFHFIITGAGYYKEGLKVPYNPKFKDLFDLSVYKKENSRQLFRAPIYTRKITNTCEEDRFLKPIVFNKFAKTIDPASSYIYTDYLPSYIENEKFTEREYTIEDFKMNNRIKVKLRRKEEDTDDKEEEHTRLLQPKTIVANCEECGYNHKHVLHCLKSLYWQGNRNGENIYEEYEPWLEVMMMCRNIFENDKCYYIMSNYFSIINPEKFDHKAEDTIQSLIITDTGFNVPWFYTQLKNNDLCKDEILSIFNLYKKRETEAVIQEKLESGLMDENGKYLNQLKNPTNTMNIDDLLRVCETAVIDLNGCKNCSSCTTTVYSKCKPTQWLDLDTFIREHIIMTTQFCIIDNVWINKKKEGSNKSNYQFEVKSGDKFKHLMVNVVQHTADKKGNCSPNITQHNIKDDLFQSKIKKCSYFSFNPETIKDFNNNSWFNMFAGFNAQLNLMKPEYEYLHETTEFTPIQCILDHIRIVWAREDDNLYDYIIHWMKQIIETPHLKTGVAVVLYGDQGTGKGCILDDFFIPFVLGKRSSCTLTGLSELMGNFNSVIRDKVFVLVNEVAYSGNEFMTGFERVKSLITDPNITINEKYITQKVNYPNPLNLVMTTNQKQSVRIQKGDRRYFCLDTSNCKKGNRAYFTNLYSSFTPENGCLFYKYLLQYKKTRDIRDIPSTSLKDELINLGLSSIEVFIEDVKENLDEIINTRDKRDIFGWKGGLGDKLVITTNGSVRVKPSDLYEVFAGIWCLVNNETNRKISARKFYLELKDKLEKTRTASNRYYILR